MTPDKPSWTVFVRILKENDKAGDVTGLKDQAKVGILGGIQQQNTITQLSYTTNLIAHMGPHWKVKSETGKVEYILSQ